MTPATVPAASAASKPTPNLLDDIFGGDLLSGSVPQQAPVSQAPATSNGLIDLDDLLGLGGSSASKVAPSTPAPTPVVQPVENIFDIFGDAPVASVASTSFVAYEKNSLKIEFSLETKQPNLVLKQTVTNTSFASDIKGFKFDAAVPKIFTLQMSNFPTNNIPPLGSVTQTVTIINPKKVCFNSISCFD